MSHVRLPSQSLHLTYYTDETCGDICFGEQPYLIPKLAPTDFLRRSRPSCKTIFIFFPNHIHLYLHWHRATHSFVFPQGKGWPSHDKTSSVLWFSSLKAPEGQRSIGYLPLTPHPPPAYLNWFSLSIKTYFSPSRFMNTFLSFHNFYISSFDHNFFSSWSSISRSLKEQSIPSL